MDTLKMSPREYKEYMDLQMLREDERNQGISQGLKQGEHNKAIETARILKQSNIALDVILKSTGLSIEEINSL
ncbi:hypothetical protein [Treponema sp.]|uniref:hypothetical protein n=1 Tax=Treponema sp. TaxID=166 RepID=UPI00388D0D16